MSMPQISKPIVLATFSARVARDGWMVLISIVLTEPPVEKLGTL